MTEKEQWNGRTGGGKWGQKMLFSIFNHVKVTTFYPVLLLVIPFYLLFSQEATRNIYRYFRHILGCTPLQSVGKTIANFFVFGEIVLDKFAMLSNGKHPFRIEYEGKEYVDLAVESDRALMMVSAHVGNMELLGHSLQQDKKTIYVLVSDGETARIQQQRAQSFAARHSALIEVKPDMSHLFKMKEAVDKKDIITVFCDRIHGSTKSIELDFLGRKAQFPLGTFLLAATLQVEMAAVFVVKTKWSRYKAYICPLTMEESASSVRANAEALAKKYVRQLEKIVREHPLQWFNYYDFWGLNLKK